MQPSEQVTQDGELLDTLLPDCRRRQQRAADEPSDEDGRSVEGRHRLVDRSPLRRVVLPLEEPQNRRVAFNACPRTRRRKHTRNPRVAVAAVDTEDVVIVPAGLGRGDGVDFVAIPQMGEQALSRGLVEQPRFETLEISERFGVALAGVVRVAADNLLETAVLGHEQASSLYPRPPATRYLEMAWISTTVRAASPSPM